MKHISGFLPVVALLICISGCSSGKKVTSKKQAVAIGLSEARKEGAKVPKKK